MMAEGRQSLKNSPVDLWWPIDGSDEWLDRVDGVMAVELLRGMISEQDAHVERERAVLEIGVWKGGWTSAILMNVLDIRCDGVDPYPGGDDIRELLVDRLRALNLLDRFSLVSALADLPGDARYSMVHIDGEHTERSAMKDLAFAIDHPTDDGIVVVDDYRNFWFPGVASALYRFLDDRQMAMFTVTGQKAYLARPSHADRYYEFVRNAVSVSVDLPVWTHWGQWDDRRRYEQSPDVCGQRVLLCGVDSPRPKRHVSLYDLIPPVALRAASKGRRMWANGRRRRR